MTRMFKINTQNLFMRTFKEMKIILTFLMKNLKRLCFKISI